jgi:hypothetical protein
MNGNIRLPNLASGTYVFKLTTNDGQVVTRRIVKN